MQPETVELFLKQKFFQAMKAARQRKRSEYVNRLQRAEVSGQRPEVVGLRMEERKQKSECGPVRAYKAALL